MNRRTIVMLSIVSSLALPISFVSAQTTGFSLPTYQLPTQTQSTSGFSLPTYDSPTIPNGVTLDFSPRYPDPGDTVTFTLNNYISDINAAKTTWYVNGKMVQNGTGIKSIDVKMGKLGESTVVSVDVTTKNGISTTKSVTLTPSSADIIWEAESYAPPFYKGKTLPSFEGVLKIVAIPNTASDAKGFIYKWKTGTDAIPGTGGYGNNLLTLKGDSLQKPFDINVEVSSAESDYFAVQRLKLGFFYPKLLFYKNDPLYGILYNQATSTVDLKDKEFQLTAAPYFFNIKDNGQADASYQWTINSDQANSSNDTITLRRPDTNGQAIVGLKVTSPQVLLQYTNSQVAVTFGQNK